jgi:thiopeptide-type bacteriocin biosynthesis protein
MPQFVLRTPTLSFDVLADWWREPRECLRTLVDNPAVREALYIASPELDGQLDAWRADPESPAGVAVERAVVRYISRMGFRPTPFGLFASVSVGSLGERTHLEVPVRAEATRHTRLDNDLLFALCADLVRDPEVRAAIRYRINTSLYEAAGRLRYAEARLAGGVRSYHLVAVDRSDYLDLLLARAESGATRAELIAVLCEADPSIADEVPAFVDEVIDTQIVVPELAPAVTGCEPTEYIADLLEARGLGQHAAPLRDAARALAAIDGGPAGAPSDAYKAIQHALAAALPTKVEANRLFQVDLFKPAPNATLGNELLDEIVRGVELLHSLAPPRSADDVWSQFRDKFVARYEAQEVPLLEVLDEESGIGFGDTSGARSSPLLADLAFPLQMAGRRTTLHARDTHLMTLVAGALRSGATEIELTDEDMKKLADPSPTPALPDVVTVTAHLIADSDDAIAAGRHQLRIDGVGRGANLLGRFCHGSEEVAELTARCLRAEEAHHPDAVFAEIVHLPEGRLGNILLRPVLRDYEIPYLGTSGAPADRQIGIDDLLVSVVGNRVVLRSRRLGREVIPRLTTAHNFAAGFGPYRFLCALAEQRIGFAYWSWGVMDDMPFLPRVRRGRYVLSRARWLLIPRDLKPLEAAFEGANAAKTPDQVRAIRAKAAAVIQDLRMRLGLPRWVVLADGDNELPIDLDNELMVDSAAHLLKNHKVATLYEMSPAPDQLCVRGPEGRFNHELFVMLAKSPEQPVAAVRPSSPALRAAPRRFTPGSSWLYFKLYTGSATADVVLRHLAPAIREAISGGLASHWFFLRYGDPDLHLRLRFAGDPRVLVGDLMPMLHEALEPACARGLVWRIVADTYEREVERYGGPHAIELAERLFHADSECVLSIVETCEGDAGADAMWRLALRGVDRLMDDLGLSLADKLAVMTSARDGFGAEVGMDTAFQRRLGDKFRAHGKELAALLAVADDDSDHRFSPALASFAGRSRAIQPLADELRELDRSGLLTQTVDDLVHSYVHMHVNRMIRHAQRRHELVLYDLLRRHYEGVTARLRKSA